MLAVIVHRDRIKEDNNMSNLIINERLQYTVFSISTQLLSLLIFST